jgi:hypothetical protein
VVINLSLSRSLEATGVAEEMEFVRRKRVVRKRERERKRERYLGPLCLVNVVLQ